MCSNCGFQSVSPENVKKIHIKIIKRKKRGNVKRLERKKSEIQIICQKSIGHEEKRTTVIICLCKANFCFCFISFTQTHTHSLTQTCG